MRPASIVSALASAVGLALVVGSSAGAAASAASTRHAVPTNVDVSQRHTNESEEAIAVNPTNPLNVVAVECVAGNLDPFTIAVYVDDELVAEVQLGSAHASEGLAGMFAQAFGSGASVSYDFFRVLVEPD